MATLTSSEIIPAAEIKNKNEFVKWDDIDTRLDINILRGVTAYGFDDPSPIQQKTLIPLLEGQDVIGQAQSGTGKTAAFAVGLLSRLNTNKNTTKCFKRSLVSRQYNWIHYARVT